MRYPKSPESKNDNDEVNGVSEKHQHVDVGHCAVLGVNQVVEKLTNGRVDLKSPGKKKCVMRAKFGLSSARKWILHTYIHRQRGLTVS